MKRVLFINHTNDVFGAETVMLQLVKHCCNKQNAEVFFVEPQYKKNSPFKSAVQNLGYKNILSLPYKNLGVSRIRSLMVMLYNLHALLALYFFVRKNNIELIYSNTSTTCLGIMLAKCTKLPHIWHIHEPIDPKHGWCEKLSGLYLKLFAYKRNTNIFVSKTQENDWKKAVRFKAKSIVIYNPIKKYDNIEKQEDNSTITFGYLGSRDMRKNIPTLIDAFAELHQVYPNTRLLLSKNIGDTNVVIAQKIKAYNLTTCIIEKQIIDGTDFFNNIDVLVLPSFSETWGMVALEAMQVGKATIITNQTGLTELLTDKQDTLFIDPYNKDSLVSAMTLMLSTKFRQRIEKNGKNLLANKNFDTHFVEQFKTILS